MDFKSSCAVLLLAVLATMASAQQCVTKDVCKQKAQSPCSCETKEGMFDLSKVGAVNAKDFVPLVGATFYFNPCQKFTMGDCKDVLMCEKLATGGTRAVGTPATTKFAKCGQDMVLQYAAGSKTAEVKLVCDQKYNAILKMISESPVVVQNYKFELRSKYACPKAVNASTTVMTTVITNTTVPQANTTVTVPAANTTVTVPAANTTVTVPHANTTVTVPAANTTVTVPHANTTVTVPHANTTVTVPSGNTTVTVPSANTTVTVPHGNTTVTLPSNITITTVTMPTTTVNSAVSTSSISAVVLAGITVIVRSIL